MRTYLAAIGLSCTVAISSGVTEDRADRDEQRHFDIHSFQLDGRRYVVKRLDESSVSVLAINEKGFDECWYDFKPFGDVDVYSDSLDLTERGHSDFEERSEEYKRFLKTIPHKLYN